MEIEFQGQLKENEIKKAVALISKASMWMFALRVLLVILILVSLGGVVYSSFSGDPLSESRVLRLIFQVLILGYFVVQPYIASRQLFKRLSAGSQNMTGSITPIGVVYRVASSGRTIDYPWSGFYHIYKADDLVVLSTADSKISIFPSSLFNNEQDWNNFLEYVDTRVQPVQ